MTALSEAARFLAAIDPDATSFTFQTFDDNKERRDPRLARILHGSLAQHSAELQRLNKLGAGVFVTINETDGKGRKSANITRVRSVFVDLDGAPLGPVQVYEKPPNMIIESSPDRWHAYWFVESLSLDEFTAVQKALIARFDSDKSVHDLPRVMRVPGFVHHKGEPFVSRIAQINNRESYASTDFERLPEGTRKDKQETHIGVDHKPSRKFGGVGNSKTYHLNSAALQNLSAWVPALFGPAAEFKSGGYRISSKALGRDLEEDLSISPKGIKDFGIHDQGDSREGKRTPIDIVIEYGKKTFGDAVAWLREQLGLNEGVSLADFYAYMPQHVYIYTPTGEPWPASSVNARIPPLSLINADGTHQLDKPDKDGNQKQKVIPASAWLDQNQPVEQMTWIPGEPTVIHDRLVVDGGWIHQPGTACLNLYRPSTIKHGNAAEARRWVELVHKVYPDDANHIINYLAQRVQQPGIKPNHGLVLGGEQGIGKDTLLEPVKQAVGHWNFREVSPQNLLGPFNPYVKAVIIRVNEGHDLGEMNRYQFYEHMKIYLASPPDVLRCDEKHVREYSVMNCCGVIITTNHKTDGLYLPANDRRHYVAWSPLKSDDVDQNYWNDVWGWYGSGGNGHVAAYLAQLDISSFDPKAPPPKTDAFLDIVNANRAPEDAELADVIDKLGNPSAVTLDEIANNADPEFSAWLRERRNRRAIPHRMEQCGFVPVRNPAALDMLYVINGRRQVVYASKDLSVRERHEAVFKLMADQKGEGPRQDYTIPGIE